LVKRRTFPPLHLRAWRLYTGRTQEECAQGVGVSLVHWGRLERGERAYTQPLLERAADFFQVPQAFLIHVDPFAMPHAPAIWRALLTLPNTELAKAARLLEALREPGADPLKMDVNPAAASRPRRKGAD
jgi:transcriptional regulator with XRE-family HTH domain